MKRATRLFCFFSFVMFCCVGCGSKSMPISSKCFFLSNFGKLQYNIVNNSLLILDWELYKTPIEKDFYDCILSICVFEEPVEIEHCVSCPLKFSRKIELPLRKMLRQDKDKFYISYTDTIKYGFRYSYKLVIKSENNFIRLESKLILLEHSNNT